MMSSQLWQVNGGLEKRRYGCLHRLWKCCADIMEVLSRILDACIVHEKCIHIDVIRLHNASLIIHMRLKVRTDFCE